MPLDQTKIRDMLQQTLDDHRLTRGEKHALRDVLGEIQGDSRMLGLSRSLAFELAGQAMQHHQDKAILEWLEDVVSLLLGLRSKAKKTSSGSSAYFSDTHDCPQAIATRIRQTRQSLDICVFTITDDHISTALLAAHRRNVKIRILTDDDKSEDWGSDIDAFRQAGIAVRTDNSEAHMHHKFAIFDTKTLLSGSYNWTRGAARHNDENFLITKEANLVSDFQKTFERLWKKYR